MSKFKNGAKELFQIAVNLSKGVDLSVSEEVKAKRRKICEECPHLTKLGRCDQCGCFYMAKTAVATSECPLQKWLKEKEV